MATKFYLRNITAAKTPTTGEKSTALASTQADNASGTEETLSLLPGVGSSQTSIAQTTDASSGAERGYHARFTSEPLLAGTYGSGTWTIAIAAEESNAASNAFLAASIYFWRPSSSTVVGFIYDATTQIGTEWNNSETGEVNNVTGANVTISDGDVLVFELWRNQTQSMATAYTNTIYYDGTTDPTDGTGTSNAASYILAPASIGIIITKNTNEEERSSELTNKILGLNKNTNETEQSSELSNKILGPVKNINEEERSSELTNRVLGIIKNILETENISELKNALKSIPVDSIEEITESLNYILSGGTLIIKIVNEEERSSELTNRLLGIIRIINETVDISELNNKIMAVVRNLNETEETSELINKLLALVKNILETENISELVNKLLALVRNVSDTENIGELSNKVLGIVKTVDEIEQIVEALNRILGIIRIINETDDISELTNKLMNMVRVSNETENIQELINKLLAINRNVNEEEQISELVNRVLSLVKNINEIEDIQELSNRVLGQVKNANETENISELTDKVLGIVRNVGVETVQLSELTNKLTGFIRNINEPENISELINKLLAITKVLNETEDIQELTNKVLSLVKNIGENEQISELVNKLLAITVNTNETEQVGESTNKLLGIVRNILETINNSELTNKVLGIAKNVNETLNISELFNYILTAFTAIIKNVNETLNTSELVNKLTADGGLDPLKQGNAGIGYYHKRRVAGALTLHETDTVVQELIESFFSSDVGTHADVVESVDLSFFSPTIILDGLSDIIKSETAVHEPVAFGTTITKPSILDRFTTQEVTKPKIGTIGSENMSIKQSKIRENIVLIKSNKTKVINKRKIKDIIKMIKAIKEAEDENQ